MYVSMLMRVKRRVNNSRGCAGAKLVSDGFITLSSGKVKLKQYLAKILVYLFYKYI